MKPVLPLLIVLALCGCQHVEPWERDILARPEMAIDPSPRQSARDSHLRNSREAGGTANTAGGGGCGCY